MKDTTALFSSAGKVYAQMFPVANVGDTEIKYTKNAEDCWDKVKNTRDNIKNIWWFVIGSLILATTISSLFRSNFETIFLLLALVAVVLTKINLKEKQTGEVMMADKYNKDVRQKLCWVIKTVSKDRLEHKDFTAFVNCQTRQDISTPYQSTEYETDLMKKWLECEFVAIAQVIANDKTRYQKHNPLESKEPVLDKQRDSLNEVANIYGVTIYWSTHFAKAKTNN